MIATDKTLRASKIDTPVPIATSKRMIDIVLSVLLVAVFSPLLLFIIIATLIEWLVRPSSRGPFFYKEKRVSEGRQFQFYKIRIFTKAALEETLREEGFIHTKPLERKPENITIVGSVLKKFYLDELGQLFNVLKGDMSFVGPRPWNPVDYENEVARGIYRKKVIRAGMTGLVQIFKGEHRRFAGGSHGLDDYYIQFARSRSSMALMRFDLWILGRSCIKLLRGEGL